ncbi:MAG: orotidine-5'-phosphate decarboxylase [Bacteroidetes bacterium]|nr:orotidine-5'-phosphate decarboxylase [Bacteroidota bacterium]
MNRTALVQEIKKKKSFLCVGLDVDLDKIPKHLLQYENPIFEFNKEIIAATHDICVAYKPNIAFYEAYGHMGWEALEKTAALIPDNIFKIADAKRGDIGNTAKRYANAFFEKMNFDSITLNPYMGRDCVEPFLEYKDKWAIILALTSNKGSQDLQFMEDSNGEKLYERVIRKSNDWGNEDNIMFVVGATQIDSLQDIRKKSPSHFYLVPGVGAQGGSLEDVCTYGMNAETGLLVNSTRGIIYRGNGKNFAQKAREAALELQSQMSEILNTQS